MRGLGLAAMWAALAWLFVMKVVTDVETIGFVLVAAIFTTCVAS